MPKKLKPVAFDKNSQKTAEVPKDLEAQVQSLKAFVSIHTLLTSGHFKAEQFQHVIAGMQFLEQLHKHAMEQAIAHKQADMVPELVAYKQANAPKAEQNAKS